MSNWIVPTETDLAGTLSQREIDAFRASPAASMDADPVRALQDQAAGQVRAACRSNGRVKMDASAVSSIPRSCLRAHCAIVAFDVLKRLPTPVGEDRRTAYRDALAFLEKVAAGAITPEGADDEDDTGLAHALPASAEPHVPPRLLD
ncbi:MAG: DUF1320 family protein [Kiritimatiellae bacterium]|nr:DUF1320 family protein [Kiritimatiellia bacterium]